MGAHRVTTCKESFPSPSYILSFSPACPGVNAVSLPAHFSRVPSNPITLHLLGPLCPFLVCTANSHCPGFGGPYSSVSAPQLGFFKRQYKDMMGEAGPEAAPSQ